MALVVSGDGRVRPVDDRACVDSDQVTWAICTGVVSIVMLPVIVALFHGWVPRWQRYGAFHSRGTAVGLGFAYVGMLVGTAPHILGASEDVGLRCLNVGSALGVVGLAIEIAASIRAKVRATPEANAREM